MVHRCIRCKIKGPCGEITNFPKLIFIKALNSFLLLHMNLYSNKVQVKLSSTNSILGLNIRNFEIALQGQVFCQKTFKKKVFWTNHFYGLQADGFFLYFHWIQYPQPTLCSLSMSSRQSFPLQGIQQVHSWEHMTFPFIQP